MKEIRRGRPKRAVGYIRVSTQRQADDGFGLEFQRERILSHAREHGYVLTMIFEDIISGNDRKSMKDRPDLSGAIREAKRIRGVIIVARIDRLSRNGNKFLELCRSEKVRIVSTAPGETEKLENALKAVAKAQRTRENISDATKRSLSAAKTKGKSLGNPVSLPAANQASRKARQTASHLKVLEIRDFLHRHPEVEGMTVGAIADLLNRAGILSGRYLPWTKDSLPRQLSRAREELKLFNEPDDD